MSEQDGRAWVRPEARYHGDQAVGPGMLDFAVNVRHAQPPVWLQQRLADRLPDLAAYPGGADHDTAVAAVAARHGVAEDRVLLLGGGSEGFALLPALNPRRAALVSPSFTEPEAVLAAAGVRLDHIVLPPPFTLAGARVPDAADLVVIGNPTNPTGVVHPRDDVLALRRPGRIVVVDEAFADAVTGDPEKDPVGRSEATREQDPVGRSEATREKDPSGRSEATREQDPPSLAGAGLPDVLVLRSLTKTWSLAGLRVGYALGAPDVLARLAARRPHWPLGTLQLEAIAACCSPEAVAEARAGARELAGLRAQMVTALRGLGLDVVDGSAPFVLFAVPDGALVRKRLAANGIAVRRCDTFVGLGENYLRAAVRPEWPALVAALGEALL